MAKNKVQFQQGLSLQDFLAQFGSEEQCQSQLHRWRWPKGFSCPECGHDKYCELKCRRLYQCKRCRHQVSLTAETIFAYTKLPLSTWFLAIYLVTQSKISVSALSLKRTLGVSYNTALLMKHKIQQVMMERDDSKPLTDYVQLDDSYWGGKKRDGQRGRGATGKIPFIAAVSTDIEGNPFQMRFSQVDSFTKAAVKSWAQLHLHPNSLLISDKLKCFGVLRESGWTHLSIKAGKGPDSVKIPEFKWVNTLIANVKRSLHGTFHAISEHHFHRYLAEFCYRFNRRFNLAELIPRFVYVALRTPPMPQRLLKLAESHG